MNITPREYFPLISARDQYLKQLDYFEIDHTYYNKLHAEYRFLIDDLFKIMKDNNTLCQYKYVCNELMELRKKLTLELSNKDGGDSKNKSFSVNDLSCEKVDSSIFDDLSNKDHDKKITVDDFLEELSKLMKSQ